MEILPTSLSASLLLYPRGAQIHLLRPSRNHIKRVKKRSHECVLFRLDVLRLYMGHSLWAEIDRHNSFKWAKLGTSSNPVLVPQTLKESH